MLRVCDPPFFAFMVARQVEALADGDWDFRIAHDWRDLDAMAPSLPLALVAAEDQQFPAHHGFDLEAIEKARRNNARGRKVRGASTISQQVAKNLFLWRSEEHTSELQSLMRISYAVFCLKKKKTTQYEETKHKKANETDTNVHYLDSTRN